MRDNYTIIKEEFNKETGVSTVTINTHYGAFTGITKMDELDAKYPSTFQGCEIALSKALKKFTKAVITILKEKIKTLRELVHSGIKSRPLFKEIKKLEQEKEMWENRYVSLGSCIKTRVESRDMIIKRIAAKNNSDKTE